MRSRYSLKLYVLVVGSILLAHSSAWAQKGQMMIRISEIEIHSEYLQQYNRILEEESHTSVQVEPGVIAIVPLTQKADPSQIRILEIYASHEAYESHLQSPHFQRYKAETLKMVKSLKLVDMNAIDPEAMALVFAKLGNSSAKERSHQ